MGGDPRSEMVVVVAEQEQGLRFWTPWWAVDIEFNP
jgi:hypothetical protein